MNRIEEESEAQELVDTLVRSMAALFKVTLSLGRPVSDHSMSMIERADDPGKLADLITVYLPLKAEIKQSLLEIDDPIARLKKVFSYLHSDIQSLQPDCRPPTNHSWVRRSVGVRGNWGCATR